MKFDVKNGAMAVAGGAAGFAGGIYISDYVSKPNIEKGELTRKSSTTVDICLTVLGAAGAMMTSNSAAQSASAGVAAAGIVKLINSFSDNKLSIEAAPKEKDKTSETESGTSGLSGKRRRKLGAVPVLPANSNAIMMPRAIPVQNPVSGIMRPGMGRITTMAPGMGKCIGGCY